MKALALFTRTAVSLTHFDILVPYWYSNAHWRRQPRQSLILLLSFSIAVRSSSAALCDDNPYLAAGCTTTQFAVAGSSGFNEEHRTLISQYLPAMSTENWEDETPAQSEEAVPDQDDKPKRNRDRRQLTDSRGNALQWVSDLPKEVEFYPSMLANLRSLGWRRLDIQFPKQYFPLHHEFMLQKRKFGHLLTVRLARCFFAVLAADSRRLHTQKIYCPEDGQRFIDLFVGLLQVDTASEPSPSAFVPALADATAVKPPSDGPEQEHQQQQSQEETRDPSLAGQDSESCDRTDSDSNDSLAATPTPQGTTSCEPSAEREATEIDPTAHL